MSVDNWYLHKSDQLYQLCMVKEKSHERILPFVTTDHPAVKNLKLTVMYHWSLIHNKPLLKTVFAQPPRKFIKDTLVKTKI